MLGEREDVRGEHRGIDRRSIPALLAARRLLEDVKQILTNPNARFSSDCRESVSFSSPCARSRCSDRHGKAAALSRLRTSCAHHLTRDPFEAQDLGALGIWRHSATILPVPLARREVMRGDFLCDRSL